MPSGPASDSNGHASVIDHQFQSENKDNDSASFPPTTPALPELCAQVHARLEAFLASTPDTERLRRVQEQSRRSLKVIEEALQRYRFVFVRPSPMGSPLFITQEEGRFPRRLS